LVCWFADRAIEKKKNERRRRKWNEKLMKMKRLVYISQHILYKNNIFYQTFIDKILPIAKIRQWHTSSSYLSYLSTRRTRRPKTPIQHSHEAQTKPSQITTLTNQNSLLQDELAQLRITAEELQSQFDELSASQETLMRRVSEEENMSVVRKELHRQANYIRTL
jgi:hypothetical protein